MPLAGAQRSRIVDALLAAYSRDELRRMVTGHMNVDFVRHVSPEKTYEAQVFEFVEWADRQGRALELLEFAAAERKQNAGLQALWAEAQGWEAETQPDEAQVAPPTTGAVPVQAALVDWSFATVNTSQDRRCNVFTQRTHSHAIRSIDGRQRCKTDRLDWRV